MHMARPSANAALNVARDPDFQRVKAGAKCRNK
jgi:hypothetical protein